MTFPKIHSDEPLPSTFVGREQEMRFLSEYLERRNQRFVFVLGPRGIGKTALCLQYARSRGRLYKWWLCLNSNSFHNVTSIIKSILAKLGPPSGVDYPSNTEKTLIIIDEFDCLPLENLYFLINEIQLLPTQIKCILCGRSTAHVKLMEPKLIMDRSVMMLQPMSQSEVLLLLHKRAELSGVSDGQVQSFFSELMSVGTEPLNFSPRFILQLFQEYTRTADFNRALEIMTARYFNTFTNLLIVPHADKIWAFPTAAVDFHQIITPTNLYFPAAPYITIPNLRHIWQEQLEEFEHLLNDPNLKESALQEFFEQNPHFLKGIDYRSVLAHPVLEREVKGPLIPDFFLQPLKSDFADILDLKTPSAQLIVKKKNRFRFSQTVADGIAQLRVYRNYFDDPEHRRRIRERYGLTAYKPNTILVIGRSPTGLSDEEFKQMMEANPAFAKIITYDDMHAKMKRMLELDIQ